MGLLSKIIKAPFKIAGSVIKNAGDVVRDTGRVIGGIGRSSRRDRYGRRGRYDGYRNNRYDRHNDYGRYRDRDYRGPRDGHVDSQSLVQLLQQAISALQQVAQGNRFNGQGFSQFGRNFGSFPTGNTLSFPNGNTFGFPHVGREGLAQFGPLGGLNNIGAGIPNFANVSNAGANITNIYNIINNIGNGQVPPRYSLQYRV